MSKWFLKRNGADIGLMSKSLGLCGVMCHVLANRGIRTKSEALSFLHPGRVNFLDEAGLPDAEKAAVLISSAISRGDRITVYGDYDVDGVTGTYILFSALKSLGADITYYIPHREEDGYGLNMKAVDSLNSSGTGLLICCDNGISAFDEIARAKSLGMNVVVLDHHEVPQAGGSDMLPPADAVVNPKRSGAVYGCRSLCAAALSYKFIKYYHKFVGEELENEDELIALSALALVCDVIELNSEVRDIVCAGLDILSQKSVNLGLSALLRARGLEGKKLGVYDLGFVIGPCLNASGRLQSAELSIGLFLADTEPKAEIIAARLIDLNEERKILTQKCVDNAVSELSAFGKRMIGGERDMESIGEVNREKVIVYYNAAIHESLAGIVAGRIRELTGHPAIVMTNSGEYLKGSARSIEGYDIYAGLASCGEIFVKFGGHEMAAGLTIERENLGVLRERLNAGCTLSEDDFERRFDVDKELLLSDITFSLGQELRMLEPCGNGNREPIFGSKRVIPETCEIIGKNRNTMRMGFRTEDGRRVVKAVCFNKVDEFSSILAERYSEHVAAGFLEGKIKNMNIYLDIIYTIDINEYNGNEYLQIKIIDFRPSGR